MSTSSPIEPRGSPAPSSPRPSPQSSGHVSRQNHANMRTNRHEPYTSEDPATPNRTGTAPIPDENHGADLPLTMTASVILTSLPKDAHQALADVEAIDAGKVTVRFQPLPSAPILRTRVFKISASQKFETVVRFLRKKLDCKESDSVFCYVNSVFAPGLDESVGGLWRCFKTDDQLIVSYSMAPAFG
ncbi:Ubiquitin-like protein [Ophidiomyces ophidiicola]|uniref:Ubiquitin-like protein n=1 Tax=Ophidiomyces ophidiicola TaxID=1387563 RepID=UPI0020C247C1|nr:Ubiquitin-like protein [Ophidiomyces ophidiicola]KAI1906302.1 Ubiquitin-like protein [Ophidiomyces ophidiicola]KAI1908370.1 Ubiquitin-like protein [Ophidiomyces ophidiicola]KAI1931057.1 Ubiquitin-like protein [Ophidiomyces ophidiicola]KAI1941481.1 Ubiquitin-like protein [Ophidiomyces ophidiicola]KAI1961674.1 Ubiquitin-like protein [Ophidiomyces ophidiicola]